MAAVVGVHGIAQQRKGPQVLLTEWGPAMRDGVSLAGGNLADGRLACAFYGALFRPSGTLRSAGDVHYRPADVTEDEALLLHALWEEAARIEPDRVPPPDAELRLATPSSVQAALRVLAGSRFFAGLAERVMISDLKQVRRYLREPDIREQAQAAIDGFVTEETRVLVGHSLGSVVAYEALHTYADDPRWANVTTLVTLGSPLGIPNLIFDQLRPPPDDGHGAWPPTVTHWTNVSDDGDVVALVKRLGPLFGDQLVDVRIDNGATAHDILPYLTAAETGKAVADGLT